MKRGRGRTWQPEGSDYNQIFEEQNPWHESRSVPDALAKPMERPLAKFLWQRLINNDPARFQLILGPRRVGKTTALYQTVKRLIGAGIPPKRIWWLRLDHPLLMEVELGELVNLVIALAGATPANPAYVFLDELTYAHSWDLWLKTFYDQSFPIRIAGSSSAAAALRNRRMESGVGRWEEQYLAPYLFGEYLELVGHAVPVPVEKNLSLTIRACVKDNVSITDLAGHRRKFLLTGGFPELLMRGKDIQADEVNLLLQSQRTLRSDAVINAIYKDIPQAFGGVENPMMLERVLYTLAGQITGVLSAQTLCQGLDGLARQTFERYLNYLERAFLVFTLPNYSGSESSKQKRGRSLYFIDGAVRNAALQRGIAPSQNPEEMGLLIENLAAGHLHALGQQSQVRLYHWRDGNDEVDLVYDYTTKPLAIEISSKPSHRCDAINFFVSRFRRFQRNCYIVSPNSSCQLPESSPDGIGSMPIDLFLLAASAQAETELRSRLLLGRPGETDPHSIQPSLFGDTFSFNNPVS